MPYRIRRDDPHYGRSRSLTLRTPTSGTRAGKDELDWWTDVRSYALVLARHTVFSHTTAAQIHGLPLPKEDPKPFHVTTQRSRGRRNGVVWHKRPVAAETELVQGFRVTSGLRTWRDLAGLLGIPDLVAIADVLLRRGHCTRAELDDTRGLPNIGLLQAAAQLADPGSKSPQESILRVALHRAGAPAPALNAAIVEDGEWLGEGDFVWRVHKVIADYDGLHHGESGQRHQDAQTRDDYAAAGWRHVAVTSAMSTDQAVGRVLRALRARGWPG